MWSVGCTLFELFTGKILFSGRTNHDMLRLFMALRGRLPRKLLRTAHPDIRAKYFDDNLNFMRADDPTRKLDIPDRPTENLLDMIQGMVF